MRLSVASMVLIHKKPEAVWPLLCNFKLPNRPKWYYRSLPFPQECKVIGKKGIGAHRKCKTTKCHLNQKITQWVPPNKLAFVVISDTGGILKKVKRLEYTITLEDNCNGTKMTCSTNLDIDLHPLLAVIRKPFLHFIMRKLQQFTINGIKILAETEPPVIAKMI